MALTLIQGKSYTVEYGLSEQADTWRVVGKAIIPIKVDKTLGWRDTHLDKPHFVSCNAFMCLPYDVISGITISDVCSFVPVFGVVSILETGDETVPTVIEAPYFTDEYEISSDAKNWLIQNTGIQPLRIDDKLTWREPLIDEEPTFVQVDSCGCLETSGPPWTTSGTFGQVPLCLATKVLDWISITGSTGSGGGLTGPRGFQGFQGTTGPNGNDGPQGVTGPNGNDGSQGVTGPYGPQGPVGAFSQNVNFVDSHLYWGNFNTYYGVIYTAGTVLFALPGGISPIDDGKMVTITDEVGGINSTGRGIYISSDVGQLINGMTTMTMKVDNMSITFIFRDSAWHIYSTHIPTIWSPFSDLQ